MRSYTQSYFPQAKARMPWVHVLILHQHLSFTNPEGKLKTICERLDFAKSMTDAVFINLPNSPRVVLPWAVSENPIAPGPTEPLPDYLAEKRGFECFSRTDFRSG